MKTTDSADMPARTTRTLQDHASNACLLLFCLYAFFSVIFRFPQRFSKYNTLTFCGAFILLALHCVLRRDQTRRSRILWSIMAVLQFTFFLKILIEIL